MKHPLPPPRPPRPDLLRRPRGPFGWLDASLLNDHALRRLGPDAVAVLTFLALAADGRGASFYRRDRMAHELDMPRHVLDQALSKLVDLGFIAFRPWRFGHPDGVWQILPTATTTHPETRQPRSASSPHPSTLHAPQHAPNRPPRAHSEPTHVAQILRDLGFPGR